MSDQSIDDLPPISERGLWAVWEQISNDKIKFAQWALRIVTIYFTIIYLFPYLGNAYDAYYKVLLSCSATNILRLYQRLPRFEFSRAFLATLVIEDSFHYFMFASIFQYFSPVTMVLLPIFLFAILHASSYSLTLLDCLGQNRWWGARLLISLVEFQSRNLLRLCALCEIIIFPYIIILIFTGKSGLLTPVIYYQFLMLRLSSRRNAFTRNVFIEIANNLEQYSTTPGYPKLFASLFHTISRLMYKLVPLRQ